MRGAGVQEFCTMRQGVYRQPAIVQYAEHVFSPLKHPFTSPAFTVQVPVQNVEQIFYTSHEAVRASRHPGETGRPGSSPSQTHSRDGPP